MCLGDPGDERAPGTSAERELQGRSRRASEGPCASETEPASDGPALPAETGVRMLTRRCER